MHQHSGRYASGQADTVDCPRLGQPFGSGTELRTFRLNMERLAVTLFTMHRRRPTCNRECHPRSAGPDYGSTGHIVSCTDKMGRLTLMLDASYGGSLRHYAIKRWCNLAGYSSTERMGSHVSTRDEELAVLRVQSTET